MKEIKLINKINKIKMKNKEIKSNLMQYKIFNLKDKMKSKKKKKENIFNLKDKMKSKEKMKEKKKENMIDNVIQLEDLILYSVLMKEKMIKKENKKISKYNINLTNLLICMMVKISLISNQFKLM